MEARFSVAIREDEFLDALSGFDLAGVEISLGIHGDGIDPVEIAGHASVIADGTFQLAGFAIVNPNFVVGAISNENVFAIRIVREGEIVSRSAHAVHGRAGSTAFHSA